MVESADSGRFEIQIESEGILPGKLLHDLFWENKSAAEQAREQGVGPITSLADLVAGDEFEEADIERFIRTIREGRREE